MNKIDQTIEAILSGKPIREAIETDEIAYNDGKRMDIGGELRLLRKHGEIYVVGRGVLIPVKNTQEARWVIKRLQNTIFRHEPLVDIPVESLKEALVFSDGMRLDTDGELRVVRKRDGYYVVGQGMCIPVNDAAEGNKVIQSMQKIVDPPLPYDDNDSADDGPYGRIETLQDQLSNILEFNIASFDNVNEELYPQFDNEYYRKLGIVKNTDKERYHNGQYLQYSRNPDRLDTNKAYDHAQAAQYWRDVIDQQSNTSADNPVEPPQFVDKQKQSYMFEFPIIPVVDIDSMIETILEKYNYSPSGYEKVIEALEDLGYPVSATAWEDIQRNAEDVDTAFENYLEPVRSSDQDYTSIPDNMQPIYDAIEKDFNESDLEDYFKAITPNPIITIRTETFDDDNFTVRVATNRELSGMEIQEVEAYLQGQASDGWGEGFEQRPVDVDDVKYYVSTYSTDKKVKYLG